MEIGLMFKTVFSAIALFEAIVVNQVSFAKENARVADSKNETLLNATSPYEDMNLIGRKWKGP